MEKRRLNYKKALRQTTDYLNPHHNQGTTERVRDGKMEMDVAPRKSIVENTDKKMKYI